VFFSFDYRVGKVNLGDPYGADDVGPLALVGLLECAVLVRTQDAVDRRRGRLYALAAQPLALGYVGHAVALLMHRQVAHVTKENQIAVHALAVQANAA
jgi:hypothetical protein